VIGTLFILLQLVPVVSWLLGQLWLPLRSVFSAKDVIEVIESPFLWSRANFDGVHYVSIAREGYGYLQEAFFPFYPSLINIVEKITPNYVLAGILISSLSFLGSLFLLKDLLKDYGVNKKTIKNTLLWLVLFPTSFYFVSVYTESLFLFLVLLSFWLARKKQWLMAGIAAAFASNTRLVGIFLVPALAYDYYTQSAVRNMKERMETVSQGISQRLRPKYWWHFIKTRAKHLKNIGFISLGSAGLLKYMLTLQRRTGDALRFVYVQSEFGANRTPKELILIYQVVWRYIKMIFTVDPQSFLYFNVWLEFLISLLFIFLIIYGWLKYEIKNGWMIFAAFSFLLPTVTGTFSSMPRYVLVCFPCFLVLGKFDLPKWVYGLSFGLLLICSMLFVRGYWIA
jgi:hypothetical protein